MNRELIIRKPRLSVRAQTLAALGAVAAGFFLTRDDEVPALFPADAALFSQAVQPHDFSLGMDVPEQGTMQLASLGSGLSLMKDLWNESGLAGSEGESPAPRYDDSLQAFLDAREGMCIPNYSEAVPWEKDRRYMVEDSGCGTQIFRSAVRSGDNAGALLLPWLDNNETDRLSSDKTHARAPFQRGTQHAG